MEKLCALIQQTTQLDPHRKPGPQLVELVGSIFGLDAAAVLDADLREVYRQGEWFDGLEDALQNICVFEKASEDPEMGQIRRVLRMGNLPIGAMLLRGELSAKTATAVASVMAITFDRYHAFANESRTESARQTEQLRTTVLESLAHAYKTPLTAIEAASGGLAAVGSLTHAQSGLVALIEEQAELLSQLTTRLLTTARLDTCDLVPQPKKAAVAPMLEDVIASLRGQLSNHAVEVTVAPEDLTLCCDRSLVVALLTQYVDNASKYGDAGTTIAVGAEERGEAVLFSVRSRGATIARENYECIFDRFYRLDGTAKKASGTGIGLSIARNAAQAHGGNAWVASSDEEGTTFYASIPMRPESRPTR
jgi:two-component system sensor histidine kinase KdpD